MSNNNNSTALFLDQIEHRLIDLNQRLDQVWNVNSTHQSNQSEQEEVVPSLLNNRWFDGTETVDGPIVLPMYKFTVLIECRLVKLAGNNSDSFHHYHHYVIQYRFNAKPQVQLRFEANLVSNGTKLVVSKYPDNLRLDLDVVNAYLGRHSPAIFRLISYLYENYLKTAKPENFQ